MSAQDITDAALRFLEIIAGWPIVLPLVVLILRREIKSLLPPLARRGDKGISGRSLLRVRGGGGGERVPGDGAGRRRGTPTTTGRSIGIHVATVEKLAQATSSAVVRPLAGKHILWADDQPPRNSYESNLLKELGAGITTVVTTDDAMRELERATTTF